LVQKGHEASCQGISLPKALDCVFDKVKYDDKKGEDDSLVQGGDDQRLLLETAAKSEQRADHDDLPENHGLDNRHPVIRVDNVMCGEQEPPVLCEGGEYEYQVDDVDQVFANLVEHPVPPVHRCLLCIVHNPALIPAKLAPVAGHGCRQARVVGWMLRALGQFVSWLA
jgi:hypothetical protein